MWLLLALGVFAAFVRSIPGLVLNYQENPQGVLERRFSYGKCLVDGVEIDCAWYIDVERGCVKSYDLGNGQRFLLSPDGKSVKSRTVHGKVRLITSEGEELSCA